MSTQVRLRTYGRYSFNPHAWIQAFGEFNSLLFSQLDQGNYSHVLQFDLSNFYDSVRLDVLERWIREEASSEKGWIITLLFYLLNHWNRRNTGLHPQAVGLPQDALADCSRILANYYLQKYDKFAASVCDQIDAMYFRYADDQMILLNDPCKVSGLLLLITRHLDRYSLRVNQKKVYLWKTVDLNKHRCRAIQSIFANKGDNKKPDLVMKFVNAYLAISKKELHKSWNHGIPLLNRLIWSNLEALPKHLFKQIVRRLVSDEYLHCADQKKLKRVFDLNAKMASPINFTARLKRIGKTCVHNAYHYEVRAFAISIDHRNLKRFCDSRLNSLEQQMRSNQIS